MPMIINRYKKELLGFSSSPPSRARSDDALTERTSWAPAAEGSPDACTEFEIPCGVLVATGKAPRHTARRNCVVILAGRAAGSTSHRTNQRFIQLSSLPLWENAGMMILHRCQMVLQLRLETNSQVCCAVYQPLIQRRIQWRVWGGLSPS